MAEPAPHQSERIAPTATDGVAVARITLPKIADHDAPILQAELLALAAAYRNRLVIDLSEVLIMGSTGIGMLINVRKSLASAGGALALARVNDDLFNMMKITKLTTLFVFTPTVPEAVGRVRQA